MHGDGSQATFKEEVQQLKAFMAKPNVRFIYSTQHGKNIRSVSPRNVGGDGRLVARYDNINKVNHLAFADKSVPDVLKDRERFTTHYRVE